MIPVFIRASPPSSAQFQFVPLRNQQQQQIGGESGLSATLSQTGSVGGEQLPLEGKKMSRIGIPSTSQSIIQVGITNVGNDNRSSSIPRI